MTNKTVWSNGKREVTGSWEYNWSSDSFTIWLDEVDETTGRKKCFRTSGDSPDWGDWKRIKD